MVGLAVGIDYALFIVNRQRRLILDRGLTAQEATSRAIGTAGSAVFFAGLTVLIALTALTLIGIALLTTMALVAAATVPLAVLIALTLLPALLGLVGERIGSHKARSKRADPPRGPPPRPPLGQAHRPSGPVILAVSRSSAWLRSPSLDVSRHAERGHREPRHRHRRATTPSPRASVRDTTAPSWSPPCPARGGAAITPRTWPNRGVQGTTTTSTPRARSAPPAGDLAIFSVIPAARPRRRATTTSSITARPQRARRTTVSRSA